MSFPVRRRFWDQVAVEAADDGFAVHLDDRPLTTPARAPLAVPTAALAQGIAAEWRRVEGEVRPETMPLTRAVNTSIDSVARAPGPVIAMIAAYGETDLLCYRAEAPEGLCRRQREAWDPLLAWARTTLGAPLVAVAGVMHQPQPPGSLAALRRAVADCDAFRLTGLSELVTLSGSLVLGLAVSRGALAGAAAWQLSRIDEDWQEEQWGQDAEAAAAAERRRSDFLAAEAYLRLLDRS